MSGNGNNAQMYGLTSASLVTGVVGQALLFNGYSTYIATPVTTQLSDFTVCAWYDAPGDSKAYNRIVDKDHTTGFWLGKNGSDMTSWGGGVTSSCASA